MNYHETNLIVEYIYRELSHGDKINFERHLTECDRCESEFKQFDQFKSFFNRRIRPEPPEELLRDYNSFIRSIYEEKEIAHLKQKRNWVDNLLNVFSSKGNLSYLRYAGTVAVLIVCLIVGKLNVSYQRVEFQNYYSDLFEQQYYPDDFRVNEYFSKVEMVLLAVDNLDLDENGEGFDIDYYTGLADELQHKTRYMMDFYERQDNDRAVMLLGQLELIFLELANVTEEGMVEDARDRRKPELIFSQEELQEILGG